ncbi:hypothetical protein R0K17_30735, partial [Planococcus sp. SIMBA_143]
MTIPGKLVNICNTHSEIRNSSLIFIGPDLTGIQVIPAEITNNPAVFLHDQAKIINNSANQGKNPAVFVIFPA